MTVSEQSTITRHIANGTTATFAAGFAVASVSEINVYIGDILQPTTAWSYASGNVVLVSIPSGGSVVSIQRVTSLKRETSYTNTTNQFLPRVLDADLDRIWRALQDIKSDSSRALVLPISETSNPSVVLAALRQLLIDFPAEVAARIAADNDLREYVNSLVFGTASLSDLLITTQQPFAGSITRTQRDKNTELLSVKDFGAVGNGVADDTAAINLGIAALQAGQKIIVPNGTYVYTADFDLIAEKIVGSGMIKHQDHIYPAHPEVAHNHLWQGFFAAWQMAHALGVQDSQRRQVPAGVTHARVGLVAATTMYHVDGLYAQDALRIQRNATTNSTAPHVMVINLTREETKPLNSQKCCLSFQCVAGANFSGSTVTARVQWSDEPEQPILADNGEYTNGNRVLASKTITPALRSKNAPFYMTFDVPEDATQVAVVFTIPFTGTAGVSDYVEIEQVTLTTTDHPARVLQQTHGDILDKARTRYQSSYPYGAPRGVITEQGAVQGIVANTNINWAVAIDVRFTPQLCTVPQFIFQSTLSGTESRLTNKDTNTTVNGLAFNLSESGVTITNNASVTAGHRLLCHWTAQVIF